MLYKTYLSRIYKGGLYGLPSNQKHTQDVVGESGNHDIIDSSNSDCALICAQPNMLHRFWIQLNQLEDNQFYTSATMIGCKTYKQVHQKFSM